MDVFVYFSTNVSPVALAPELKVTPKLEYELVGASHAMVARFPGDGALYGPHYDGDGMLTRLTMIVYTSDGWSEPHGGQLCMLDERDRGRRCWRSVPPRAGTLVVFRSESVLHQVLPTYKPRVALTVFFTAGRDENTPRERPMPA